MKPVEWRWMDPAWGGTYGDTPMTGRWHSPITGDDLLRALDELTWLRLPHMHGERA